jgi:hypothetical protein
MPKSPAEWTESELLRIRRALADGRLGRVDLFFWTAVDVEGRSAHDVAVEAWLTETQVTHRVNAARQAVAAALGDPAGGAGLDVPT